jgi:hypothetical protein
VDRELRCRSNASAVGRGEGESRDNEGRQEEDEKSWEGGWCDSDGEERHQRRWTTVSERERPDEERERKPVTA